MSVFEEQNAKEVHQKWKNSVPFQKRKLMTPSFCEIHFYGYLLPRHACSMASAQVERRFFISVFHVPVRNHLSARSDMVWCRCLPRSPDNCADFLFWGQHKRQKCSSRVLYQSWASHITTVITSITRDILHQVCGTSWIIFSTAIVSSTENVSCLCVVCAKPWGFLCQLM